MKPTQPELDGLATGKVLTIPCPALADTMNALKAEGFRVVSITTKRGDYVLRAEAESTLRPTRLECPRTSRSKEQH